MMAMMAVHWNFKELGQEFQWLNAWKKKKKKKKKNSKNIMVIVPWGILIKFFFANLRGMRKGKGFK